MELNKKNVENSIKNWSKSLEESVLPSWEDLPEIELYMDQVITLLGRYLSVLGDSKIITKSMINNYVKLGIMPAPEKKRYRRSHLAYLIIICMLKQTLNMEIIKKVIPIGISENEVRELYCSFAENQRKAFLYVSENVKSVAGPILGTDSQKRIADFVIQVSIASNICKVLTENMIDNGEVGCKNTDGATD